MAKKYGLEVYPCADKLVSADMSDLHCVGAVYIHLCDVPTRALVSKAVSNDILVGWPDLTKLLSLIHI